MHRGFLKLWRKLEDSKTFSRGCEHVGFFVYLLMRANHRAGFFAGLEILPGQIACSTESLGRAVKWTRGKIRRHLAMMSEDGAIRARQCANRFTLITICNWDTYQGDIGVDAPIDAPTVRQPCANRAPQSKNVRMKEGKNTTKDPRVKTLGDAITKAFEEAHNLPFTAQGQMRKDIKAMLTLQDEETILCAYQQFLLATDPFNSDHAWGKFQKWWAGNKVEPKKPRQPVVFEVIKGVRYD